MVQEQIKKLDNDKSIEKEIKQYVKILKGKESKYESLADMKIQLFSELCSSAFSDEDLDLLKDIAKIKIIYINDNMNVEMPVVNAFNLAMFTVFATINGNYNNGIYSMWYIYAMLIIILLSVRFRKSDQLERISFYNMLLELIENAEKKRGHTFIETLLHNENWASL